MSVKAKKGSAKPARKDKAVKVAAKPARRTPGVEKISTAQFIRSEIVKGTDNEKILKLARARPEAKGQNISDYYVNWYRWQMKNRPTAKDPKVSARATRRAKGDNRAAA